MENDPQSSALPYAILIEGRRVHEYDTLHDIETSNPTRSLRPGDAGYPGRVAELLGVHAVAPGTIRSALRLIEADEAQYAAHPDKFWLGFNRGLHRAVVVLKSVALSANALADAAQPTLAEWLASHDLSRITTADLRDAYLLGRLTAAERQEERETECERCGVSDATATTEDGVEWHWPPGYGVKGLCVPCVLAVADWYDKPSASPGPSARAIEAVCAIIYGGWSEWFTSDQKARGREIVDRALRAAAFAMRPATGPVLDDETIALRLTNSFALTLGTARDIVKIVRPFGFRAKPETVEQKRTRCGALCNEIAEMDRAANRAGGDDGSSTVRSRRSLTSTGGADREAGMLRRGDDRG